MPGSTTLQRLYLMQLGTSTIPTTPPTPGSAGCYLVQTNDGKNILIDSGLPADYTPPPGSPPRENEKSVLEHLVDLKLRPDDIDLLICTHFDVDHAAIMMPFRRQNSSSSVNTMNWHAVGIHAMLPHAHIGIIQHCVTD